MNGRPPGRPHSLLERVWGQPSAPPAEPAASVPDAIRRYVERTSASAKAQEDLRHEELDSGEIFPCSVGTF
jgi:hypothetical protein